MKIKILLSLAFIFGSLIFSQVDYTTQIQPIFNSNCTGCHGSSGGLNLSSYDNLMSGTSNHGPVITPLDADNSILVQKIMGTADFGSRMPANNQPYFDTHEEELQLIKDWINEGANPDPPAIFNLILKDVR